MAPGPGRPRGRDPRRAASILAAAAREFARTGFAAPSMDDVAAEAGISKLVVYRHFRSKHDLYRAVLDEVRSRMKSIERPAPADGSWEEALEATAGALLATLEVARAVPDAYRLLYEHAAREPEFADYVREEAARGAADAAAMLAGMVEDPLLRAWLARVIGTTVDQAVLAWLDIGTPERDREMAARLARVLAGMVGSQLTR